MNDSVNKHATCTVFISCNLNILMLLNNGAECVCQPLPVIRRNAFSDPEITSSI